MAAENGWHAALLFVIQMDGVTQVRPNTLTHPEFALALQEAQDAGVQVLFLRCHVEPDRLVPLGLAAPFEIKAFK